MSPLNSCTISREIASPSPAPPVRRDRDGSTLIACYVDKSYAPPGSGVWWEVIGAEVTNDETTRAIVDQREAGRVNQRYHY